MNGDSASVVNEFHPPPEALLEEVGEIHEPVERLRAGGELDQQVHVTTRRGRGTEDRPEEGQPDHAQSAHLFGALREASLDLGSSRYGCWRSMFQMYSDARCRPRWTLTAPDR
jgi:hypothetical protein